MHADIPWGKDQRKESEFFVQELKDLNEDMESLEKVYNLFYIWRVC